MLPAPDLKCSSLMQMSDPNCVVHVGYFRTALRKPKPVKRRRFVGTNEGMAVKSSKSSSQHLEAEEVFEPVSQVRGVLVCVCFK